MQWISLPFIVKVHSLKHKKIQKYSSWFHFSFFDQTQPRISEGVIGSLSPEPRYLLAPVFSSADLRSGKRQSCRSTPGKRSCAPRGKQELSWLPSMAQPTAKCSQRSSLELCGICLNSYSYCLHQNRSLKSFSKEQNDNELRYKWSAISNTWFYVSVTQLWGYKKNKFCCEECQYFTLKVQNPTAFKVFQTIGNKNGNFHWLVFPKRKWELK